MFNSLCSTIFNPTRPPVLNNLCSIIHSNSSYPVGWYQAPTQKVVYVYPFNLIWSIFIHIFSFYPISTDLMIKDHFLLPLCISSKVHRLSKDYHGKNITRWHSFWLFSIFFSFAFITGKHFVNIWARNIPTLFYFFLVPCRNF